MADEYFIRAPEDETASGPFSMDALQTLAEAGKLTPDHYFFNHKLESWIMFKGDEAMMANVFPQRKKLSLRRKTAEEIESLNAGEEAIPEVKVEEVLAAAEGHTDETRHVRTRRQWRERAAALSVPLLAIMLLVSAASVLYPSWNIIQALLDGKDGALRQLFERPVVFIGAIDLLMGIFLLLNATEIFPLIRFRAMIGAGFFAVVYAAEYINGDPVGIWMACCSIGFGLGVYICTLTLNFQLMVIAATVGLAGAGGIFWFSNLAPLFME